MIACGLLFRKTYQLSQFLFRNYNSLTRTTVDYKQFIKNPSKAHYVLLKNITCPSSPDLFKQHMKIVDRDMIGGTK